MLGTNTGTGYGGYQTNIIFDEDGFPLMAWSDFYSNSEDIRRFSETYKITPLYDDYADKEEKEALESIEEKDPLTEIEDPNSAGQDEYFGDDWGDEDSPVNPLDELFEEYELGNETYSIALDDIQSLTLENNQADGGSAAQSIAAALGEPIGDRDTPGTPNYLASQSCVAGALYNDLLLSGADVEGSLGEFMVRQMNEGDISAVNAYVGERENIAGDYTVNGESIRVERITDYNTYLELIENENAHGVVRINGEDGHNMNVFTMNGQTMVSDNGNRDRHGDLQDVWVSLENFTYYERIIIGE